MRLSWVAITSGTVVCVMTLYVATCLHTRTERQDAFDTVNVGDTVDSVIKRIGKPSVRETPEKLFARYASTKCDAPCSERLWFENRLAFDTEAWSVSIGADGRVVEKYHWVSP